MKNGGIKSKPLMIPKVDLRAPDAVEQFRRASQALTHNIRTAKKPQKTAREWLVAVGILTPSGRLSKHYR